MNLKMAAGTGAAILILAALPLQAEQQLKTDPPILRKVRYEQKLNSRIPLGLTFRDESGKTVRLGDFFGKKPVLLSLVYFNCPALCTEVLNGELITLRSIPLDLGKDFEAVTVSFDPTDTPDWARAKRDVYAGQYGRPGAVQAWHFLTGDQKSIDALTQAVGFQYAYDSANRMYAHPAGIVVLTPDGRIARYFYGVEFLPRDVRLGLVAASGGEIGTITDKALMYCYRYDPESGKYGVVVMNIVRIGCGLTVLALGIFMFVMFRRDRRDGVASLSPTAGAKVQ
ncbi:MAG: SCO family protein [Candidatus Acidiferrales bacterium]